MEQINLQQAIDDHNRITALLTARQSRELSETERTSLERAKAILPHQIEKLVKVLRVYSSMNYFTYTSIRPGAVWVIEGLGLNNRSTANIILAEKNIIDFIFIDTLILSQAPTRRQPSSLLNAIATRESDIIQDFILQAAIQDRGISSIQGLLTLKSPFYNSALEWLPKNKKQSFSNLLTKIEKLQQSNESRENQNSYYRGWLIWGQLDEGARQFFIQIWTARLQAQAGRKACKLAQLPLELLLQIGDALLETHNIPYRFDERFTQGVVSQFPERRDASNSKTTVAEEESEENLRLTCCVQ
jgi:hypothetical protein